MSRAWSPFQQAVFSLIADHSPDAPHVAVRARAGSGKTTTGIHALSLTPRTQSVGAVAFNADIAKTLNAKLSDSEIHWAEARTLHSAGFAAVRGALGSVQVDKDKVRKMARQLAPDELGAYHNAICRVVSLAKSTLELPTPTALSRLATSYLIDGAPEPFTPERDRWAEQACRIFTACARPDGSIDFDDMCWLPIALKLPIRPWDFAMVDEAQDLNACQHELVKKLIGRRGRLLAIGDDRQAIYQFRGAQANSFDDLANHFDAVTLSLPICYRCDAAIVQEANAYVPDLQAREGAPDGIVREASTEAITVEARPGDFVLSRTKAPLLGHCLALLAEGTPATIVGRDIAGGLITMIKQSKQTAIDGLIRWLDAHQAKAAQRLAADDPEAYEEIADRCECLRVVSRDAPSVGALQDKINRLFADAAGGGQVRLSTTHKAKGLEADRVWMLGDTYMKRAGIAEENLAYVAITRARHELVMCYKDPKESESERG